MLGAGHIGEYLLHHHKLYMYPQQGWQDFNSLLKTFFFHCNLWYQYEIKIILFGWWLSWHVLWLIGYNYTKVLDELLHVQQHQFNNNNDSYESRSDDESNSSENDIFRDDINDIMTI